LNINLLVWDVEVSVDASSGLAIYTCKATSYQELMKCADEAMYYAKENKLGYPYGTPRMGSLTFFCG
jgi:GGDEF domain-containing protein